MAVRAHAVVGTMGRRRRCTRLCDMAQDMCSTDTCHGRLAPLSLRKDIALWHPIVARTNNIQVRLFVPVLAEIAAAGAANDGPMCVVCMCDPPAMVLEPCGHLCLCADDWQHLVGGPRRSLKCPLCRAPVEAAWRIRSLSAAEEEPAGNKPAAHLSGSTDTGPGPEQADMDIDDVIGLDLDLDPEAFAAAIRTVRVLTMFQRLIEHMEPSATSNSGSGSSFAGAHSGAHRRRGNGGVRSGEMTGDGDHGDDDMRGDGHRYSSMGRPPKGETESVTVTTTATVAAAAVVVAMTAMRCHALLPIVIAIVTVTTMAMHRGDDNKPLSALNRPACLLRGTTLTLLPRTRACRTTLPLTRSWPLRAISLMPSTPSADGPLFRPQARCFVPSIFSVLFAFFLPIHRASTQKKRDCQRPMPRKKK
ncbi:Zinc-finger domain containing protein [Pandoravirus celtis]|uniref:Zinc-finger domain containing protein n=1 Tax=Pandoravirus celtis TaxID=2568002 RepID=A0A4D6EI17_9VIRU|nr:Zinc-finger domain containing protein [Pandoravirus celtis]